MGCRHSCVIAGEVIQEIHDKDDIFCAGDNFDGIDVVDYIAVDDNLCSGDDDAGRDDDADSKAGEKNGREVFAREVDIASAA